MQSTLETPVLVLNRLWQAVNTCSAKRAFTLLYQGHAQVVSTAPGNEFVTHDFASWQDFSNENPDREMVQTISMKIRIPRIIVLLMFERLPKKEVKFTRHNVFERDANTCQYCGIVFSRDSLNLDHIMPRDRGGQHAQGKPPPARGSHGAHPKTEAPEVAAIRPYFRLHQSA
jgi:hypothetical protein